MRRETDVTAKHLLRDEFSDIFTDKKKRKEVNQTYPQPTFFFMVSTFN